ncbi:zinc finger protein CONSTANS-LIKE 13 [Primulina eburnea]|uniref:zinc finger protein CONSTANS-LIKE 13 n=1 Tax=Primulina eburnea TaxID=1245227 RepID=UPI003C6BFFB0
MRSMVDQESNAFCDYEIRLCDFCNESTALLYCRADSAKLCLNCDREVHSTNQLFAKHSRCLLCDSCDSSPASIFCCSESVVLCQNCDWETHKDVRCIHDRRPLEWFNGCPSVSELLNILGFEELGKKSLDLGDGNDEEWSDLLVWETPSIVSIDDLIVSNDSSDSGHRFQAMGVPPLPKNRNATCGKYKEEILCQLREMAKAEPNYSSCLECIDSHDEFIPQAPEKCQLMDKYNSPGMDNNTVPTFVTSYETSAHEQCDYTGVIRDQGFHPPVSSNFIEINHLVTDKDSDVGHNLGTADGFLEMQPQVLADSKMLKVISKGGVREMNSQERETAISRYKEKRKTRRYNKQIRYESRKVRAEGRTRIKGRFAKMDR